MVATRGPKFRPRDAFINDFIVQILSAKAMGDHILIGIDANKEMGTDRIGIVKLMQECELIDLLMCFPSESPPPDTYNPGNTRIDYTLGLHMLLNVSWEAARCPTENVARATTA